MSSLKKKQSSSLMMSMSLPEDIIVDIIAHVPRCHYPTLSRVSKSFQSIVASPELYKRRSSLGCAEHCFYVEVSYRLTNESRWYILLRKPDGFRLVPIPLLLDMPYTGTFVAVGSKIYVFGTQNALSIDCKSHTVNHLPDMPRRMCDRVANIIDGKIYVISEEFKNSSYRVMVFDTKLQMWEPQMIKADVEIHGMFSDSVVMDGKMYMRDYGNLVYEPKDNIWEREEMLDSEPWENACVIDDILYYYNTHSRQLKAYDSKQRCWTVVKGVKPLVPRAALIEKSSHTVSYGGRLAVFLTTPTPQWRTQETRCAEISLERREGGEIWGKVERCDVVIQGQFVFFKFLAVMA